MSNNVNGQNTDLSKILNQYKEMHKASGANVDKLDEKQLQSIFEQDISDGKIDGKYQENGKSTNVMNGFDSSKVTQDTLEALNQEYSKLSESAKSDNTSETSNEDNQTNNNSSSGMYNAGEDPVESHNVQRQLAQKRPDLTNMSQEDAMAKYQEFQTKANNLSFEDLKKEYASDERFKMLTELADQNFAKDKQSAFVINSMTQALSGDIDIAKLSPEEKQLAQQVAGGEISLDEFEQANGNIPNSFNIRKAINALSPEGADSSHLVAGNLEELKSARLKSASEQKKENKVQLTAEQKQIAQDMASGKIARHGWTFSKDHPLNRNNIKDPKIQNAILEELHNIEGGKGSKTEKTSDADKTDKASGSDDANKTDKTDKSSKTNSSDKTSDTDKTNKTDKTTDTDKENKSDKADSSDFDVNKFLLTDLTNKKEFKLMDKHQKIAALKEKLETIKQAKKDYKAQLEQDKGNEELQHKYERCKELEDEVNKVYRQYNPSFLSKTLGWLSPIISIGGALTGHGAISTVFSGLRNIFK